VLRKAKVQDPQARFLLRTIAGVDEILSHVLAAVLPTCCETRTNLLIETPKRPYFTRYLVPTI
jgi:hypothetical protein